MTITTLTSRELNQDVARARMAAKSGPVFITDRGKPVHLLPFIEDDRLLAREGQGSLLTLSRIFREGAGFGFPDHGGNFRGRFSKIGRRGIGEGAVLSRARRYSQRCSRRLGVRLRRATLRFGSGAGSGWMCPRGGDYPAVSRCRSSRNTAWSRYGLESRTATVRVLRVTTAPTLSNRSRSGRHYTRARSVPRRAVRRIVSSTV